MEAFGGKRVLLPSRSALNVLSLSLPLLRMGHYSQALFPRQGPIKLFITVTVGLTKKKNL